MYGQKTCQCCHQNKINSAHKNAKYCNPCRDYLRAKPKGTLTKQQIEVAKKLAGTMPRELIASSLNTSLANLKRSCPDVSFAYFNKFAKDPVLTKEICLYYSQFGKLKTKKKYPDVRIRSVVENPVYKKWLTPRQQHWSGLELIELIKMRGFLTKTQQARYFKRPNANEGSITSGWQKTLKIKSSSKVGFHCVSNYKIKRFLKKGCPRFPIYMKNVKTAFLWHDVNKHLKNEAPQILKDTAKAIAEFQEWLYQSKNPRKEILKMIKLRS
jgi:hypothetical protein